MKRRHAYRSCARADAGCRVQQGPPSLSSAARAVSWGPVVHDWLRRLPWATCHHHCGSLSAPCCSQWRVLPLRRRYAQLMRNSQHHLGLVRNVTQAYPFESLVLWTACASPQNVDRLGFLSPLQAQGEGQILEKKAPAAGAIPAAEPDSCSQAWPTSGRSAHGWRTAHLAVTVAAFLSFLLQQPSPRNSCMGVMQLITRAFHRLSRGCKTLSRLWKGQNTNALVEFSVEISIC
ncbi:uncharacterized protein LOC106992529 [Macaca mulatta]